MLPPKLQKGDTVGLVAPSKCREEGHEILLKNAIKVLKNLGLKVALGKSIEAVDKYGVSAGSAQLRADDINKMFSNSEIKCIWCAWGGDTANEVLELLDYDLIRKNPKIFLGLSDNTVLINAIYKKTGLVIFHGTDAKVGNKDEYFDSKYSQDAFKRRFIDADIGEINRISEWRCLRKGKATGKILGGNISCLLKLIGTSYFPDLTNAILILEGYHENIREAITKLIQLKHLGAFDKIAGIVVGYYYSFDKEEQFDKDGNRIYFEDIVLDVTKGYDFPILKIYEFGHKCPSTFLPIGGKAEVDTTNKSFKIVEKCVE